MPRKAYSTNFSDRNASKNREMAKMMTTEGMQIATVQASAPRKPSSSQRMEKIKSFCGSETYKCFSLLLPKPTIIIFSLK